ncbi:hypothetical protein EDC96DRAFT_292211 [Choanephora cucurbitarum]|nr:hypothetical protein EDC96DRAFT_292211 [Choanephora cucurbitarum]
MATSSEEAALLKQSLTENELQQKNHQLQTTLQELSERNLSLQNELEVVRLEKEKLQSTTLTIENEKKETEQKLVQLTDSERLLREYIKTTVDTLNSKRDALQKTQAELNELRQKEITNRIEIERATFQIRQLQTSTQSIEHQLLTANARVESLNNQIRALENERDNLREDMRLERSRLEEKLEDLKAEKESSSDQIEQLHSQLEHARDRVLQAEDKLADMKAARDQLELSLGSTSQAFKKLQKIHEEYSVDSHKRMAAYEAKVALISKEKEDLDRAKKELEQQLSDERELRKAQFNQITGLHAANDDDDSKPPSDLLKLIHEYQQIGKHPEDIFQDYFELRSKYMQSIQKNAHESDCVESLSRKLNEKAKLFDRVHRELQSAKAANIDLEQKIQQEKTQRQQAEASHQLMTHQMDDLKKENNSLKTSLNDTTYQLQFILSDIERRNQPIPATLKSTATLLNGAEITPSLPHNQLVYTNVAELQDCNKQLMIENKTLKDKVQKLSDEAGTSDLIRRSDTSFYKAAVEEAKQAMSELETKNQELQTKLDRKSTECDNYQKIINQFGDSDDVSAKFAQIQETQNRQREEMDVTFDQYRKETLVEVNKLKEELESARNSDREARLSLSEVSSQRRYLEQRVERLNASTEELNQELKSAHRQSDTLHERITARDKEIAEIKSELQDYKARVENLRYENTLLTTRMEIANN